MFESCNKPTIAAVHGACVGAAMDIITACDIRICDSSASFCVKEIDLAIPADMGTLQRLPKLIGEGGMLRLHRNAHVLLLCSIALQLCRSCFERARLPVECKATKTCLRKSQVGFS